MTIFKKNLLVLGLAAAGFFAVLTAGALVFMNSLYYQAGAQGVENTAQLLLSVIGREEAAALFTSNGGKTLQKEVLNSGALNLAGITREGAYRLTLLDTAGEVLWDSHAETELVNHLDRREIRAALAGEKGSVSRISLSTGTRQIYSALPVFDVNGTVVGVFRLSSTVPGFRLRIPAALPFISFACVLFAAAFTVLFAFSRNLSSLMGKLVNAARNAFAALRPAGDADGMAADEFFTLEKILQSMGTELKTRLEQARAETIRLEAILNSMGEAVFAMDAGLVLHLANPRARELFQLGEKNIHRISLLEATRSTELEEAARSALAKGVPLETVLQLRSNQEQRLRIFAAPIAGISPPGSAGSKFPSGRGVVLVLQDITQLVKLEQVRKDFVANVSHELRTPIQLIKGFSETLLESELDDKDQIHRFIEIIGKNAHIMENLTDDLLILASLENGGEQNRALEEQRLAPLLAEAVSSVEPQARKKRTGIIVQCPVELRANLHGSFIIQALINLLDNAIKYSPEGSDIEAEARKEDGQLILEVRDHGIGIPAEYMGRIFERFYRVDRSRSREAGGTGLGLSIVRHIALLHNGTAEAESRPGIGSVFRIRIP